MKIILAAPAFGLLLASLALGTPAMATADGDEKCGPDGYVLKYHEYNNRFMQDGWKETARHCDQEQSSSRERRSYDERQGRASLSDGDPADGDEKCGPDGYILKYRRYNNQFMSDKWTETARRCH